MKFVEEINKRASILYKAGDLKEAYKLYTVSISLNSNDALIFNNRSIISLKLKNFNSALEDINEAIRISNNNSLFLNTKSSILLKMGQTIYALATINEAIDIENNVENLTNKVIILRKLRRLDEALRLINLIKILLSDFNLDIEIYHGILLFETKKFKDAAQIFFKILDLCPENNIARLYTSKISKLN